jgi:hypothetical protein
MDAEGKCRVDSKIPWPSWGSAAKPLRFGSLRVTGLSWLVVRLFAAVAVNLVVAAPLLALAWFLWPSGGPVFPPPSTGHLFSWVLPLAVLFVASPLAISPLLAGIVLWVIFAGTREHAGFRLGQTRRWRQSWLAFEAASSMAIDHAISDEPQLPTDPALADYWSSAPIPTIPAPFTAHFDELQTHVIPMLDPTMEIRRGEELRSLVVTYLGYALAKWAHATDGLIATAGDSLIIVRGNSSSDAVRMQLWCILTPVDNGRQISVETQTGVAWWVGKGSLLDGSRYEGDLRRSARLIRSRALPWDPYTRAGGNPFLWMLPPVGLWVATGPIRRGLFSPRSLAGQYLALFQPQHADLGEVWTIKRLRMPDQIDSGPVPPELRADHKALIEDFRQQAMQLVQSAGLFLSKELGGRAVSA